MSRRLLVPLLAVALLAGALIPAAPAGALPRTNPANRLLRVPVDTLRYDPAKRCRTQMTKGALALARWLERNTRGQYWGGLRCERLSKSTFSMHAEGRAVDWRLDAGVPAERREAKRLLRLLFSSDRHGEPNALARRMGIVEAIYDCRYHGFWMPSGTSRRYGACRGGRVDRTTAHRDHVHLSLGWPGARMRTSFWRYLWLGRALPEPQDPPLTPQPPAPAPAPAPGPPPESPGDLPAPPAGPAVPDDEQPDPDPWP